MKRQWEDERQKLLGENEVLQDATKRLNSEVRSAKDEVEKYAESEKAGRRYQVVTQSVSADTSFILSRDLESESWIFPGTGTSQERG